jgi:fluoride exporter
MGPVVCYEREVQVFVRSAPMSGRVLAAVAIGGAIGASARWLVGGVVDAVTSPHQPATWPWATLVVNIVGCMAIGVAARRIDRNTTSWAFTVTGVLGGFTTFSAFAVELNDFADAGRLPVAVLYGVLTLAGGVAATTVALGRAQR